MPSLRSGATQGKAPPRRGEVRKTRCVLGVSTGSQEESSSSRHGVTRVDREIHDDLLDLPTICHQRQIDVDRAEAARFGADVTIVGNMIQLVTNGIKIGEYRPDDAEDEIEMMFARGWSDGLPVVPPTEERVMRMLTGTTRAPSDIVATVPPDLVGVTVE